MMNAAYELRLGDCMDVLRTLDDASVDSVVCDPPYHLTQVSRGGHARTNNPEMPHGRHRIGDKGFMGKVWDGGDIAHRVELWAECLRVLKPGGHLLAFAATRTYHRMTCAIEDAGFEIRDMVPWHYGSGFPKSKNLDGQWEGWGTALKPATEPICMARKPLIGTVAANVEAYGTGAINIDACRIAGQAQPFGNPTAADGWRMHKRPEDWQPSDIGRWPANVIHDGSPEVLEQFPDAPGQMADASLNPAARASQNVYGSLRAGRANEPSVDRVYSDAGSTNFAMKPGARRLDTGSAARFFYCVQMEDEEWLEALSPALTAAANLSLQKLSDAIAQSDAAISVLPVGRRLSVSKAPSTIVTPKQSRQIAERVIETIQHFGNASLLALPQGRHSLIPNPVSVAASLAPTGTMTITASHSELDGSAGSITFSITPTNSVVVEKDCAPSTGSRFMYCAKASRTDRNEGIGGSDAPAVETDATMRDRETADWQERNGNHHPTVKPTDLMAYLCRLVTPPGGIVLDPFMGSGSTGKAAMREGFKFIGIDMTPEYVAIAEARIKFEYERVEQRRIDASRQSDMFAEIA
ncbi:DNA modification methylase [Paraburkholderia phenazinium]|uniref:site-specific DNA-methyltransferase (adenine-specific) n=1 Tax=Paraburkholderia phenazinium TaxID=60549 RepID=A0A1G7ZP66_9BURK|nr:DNA methyltransferase [Paraburkholderia phenazinium]SDH10468.1 DNA modification methylase [Paraburkholderia phenazinium]